MKRFVCMCIAVSFLTSGCGDSNWFKNFYKPGQSSNVESLESDADVALINKDFGAALNYYRQILEKDPSNSEALYGAAAAELGANGFDMVSVITNILTNQDKLQSPVLAHAMQRAGITAKTATDSLLPENFDWLALRGATWRAIEYLRTIVRGQGDGVIKATNSS
ncbi:MAG: hypothetical protein GF384_07910, partial [Elusimicrobia bacterium]|nr:hypothetical protein [Elusimicrobiota bacterium]